MLLETEKYKILVDAGIQVGKEKNAYPLIPEGLAKKLDAIIVCHAHIDHTGYVPFLVKQGFKGNIFATTPTRDIMHLLLSDAAKIAKENKTVFYNTKDIEKTMKLVKALGFGKETEILQGIKLKFLNAGHILGSAEALIKADEKSILYSGDINTRESNLLLPAELPKEKIDVLIMESTYAGKKDILPSLQKSSKELADEIKNTLKRNGKVLIPSFAVGRGQEVMFAVENYVRSRYLPEMDIWLDGMLTRANRICRHNVVFMKPEIPNRILMADDDPFKSPYFKQPKSKNKKEVFQSKKAIIISTSGMMSGGPALGYFKRLAPFEKNAVIFVGYQAEGTLGRELIEGKKTVEIRGQKIKVRCRIKQAKFSGHADYNGLLGFALGVNAEKTLLIHGEKNKLPEFRETLEKRLKKTVLVPNLKETIHI